MRLLRLGDCYHYRITVSICQYVSVIYVSLLQLWVGGFGKKVLRGVDKRARECYTLLA